MKFDGVELEKFDKLKRIIGKTKQTKISSELKYIDNGLMDEQREELSILEKRNKEETLTKEDKKRMEELRKKREQKNAAISILRGISIRIPLLVYGIDKDINYDITIDEFADMVDDESWNEFMPEGVTKDLFNQNKLEAPKTDADMLYYIYWDNGFSSGYSQYISFYYAIANILPMETLREFEFNPAKIDLIADKLYEIEKNYNGNAQINNSYQLVDNINSIALNDNIQPITKIENSIKDIEYFYNNIKGYSIFDDLELLPYLNNMIYCIDLKTGNEKLLNSNNYLKDTYEYYGNVLPKSYFSKENSNPIYVYIENGEEKATIINDDRIENYVNYYNNLENSLNK